MQLYIELKYNPEHLITDGLMAYSRNSNYLGEFLIYASFALLSMSWIPFAVIGAYPDHCLGSKHQTKGKITEPLSGI